MQAFSNLRVLRLSRLCVDDLKDLSQLHELEVIFLREMRRLGYLFLPPLQKLRHLEIAACPELQFLNCNTAGSSRRAINQDALTLVSVSDCSSLLELHVAGVPRLQALSVTGCLLLERIAGIDSASALETCTLNGCDAITRLDVSNSSRLSSLDLRSCTGLLELVGLGGLQKLQELRLPGCSGMRGIAALEGLGHLRQVDLWGCSSLEELQVHGCSSLTVLAGLEGLLGLRHLSLTSCSWLRDLKQLSGLASLTCLRVVQSQRQEMGLEDVLAFVGTMHYHALETLELEIPTTPASFNSRKPFQGRPVFDTRALRKVRLDISARASIDTSARRQGSRGRCEPQDSGGNLGHPLFGEPPPAEWGRRGGSRARNEQPDFDDHLGHLDILGEPALAECVLSLPSNMQSLSLSGCQSLTTLQWPPSVSRLNLCNMAGAWMSLQGLSTATTLVQLTLAGCDDILTLDGLSCLMWLTKLAVGGCNKLTSISTDRLPARPLRIQNAVIWDCPSLVDLDYLLHAAQLTQLKIGAQQPHDAMWLTPAKGPAAAIVRLDLRSNQASSLGWPGMGGLINLHLEGLPQLTTLEGLQAMPWLTQLVVSHCPELAGSLKGLAGLRSLQLMHIDCCVRLSDLEGHSELTQLAELTVKLCPGLRALAGLRSLRALQLAECPGLSVLGSLQGAQHLTRLSISMCNALQGVGGLAALTELRRLSIVGCHSCADVGALGGLIQLQELTIRDGAGLGRLEGWSQLSSLQRVEVEGCVNLAEPKNLSGVTRVSSLTMEGCGHQLVKLVGLGKMVGLQKMRIKDCVAIDALEHLGGLPKLAVLEVVQCPALEALSLGGMAALSSLQVKCCGRLSKLVGLENVQSLRPLNVEACHNEMSAVELVRLPKLAVLEVVQCPALEALDLSGMAALSSLQVKCCGRLSKLVGLENVQSLRLLNVEACHNEISAVELVRLTWVNHLSVDRVQLRGDWQRSYSLLANCGVGG
jgi:Leucine-rich repeat (LRR) protein